MENVNERHKLLSRTIGTRPEEDVSHSTIAVMLPIVLVFFIVGSSLEVAAYLLFNYKVLYTTLNTSILVVMIHLCSRSTHGRTC